MSFKPRNYEFQGRKLRVSADETMDWSENSANYVERNFSAHFLEKCVLLLINRKKKREFNNKICVIVKVYVKIVGYYINSQYLCSQKIKI